MSDFDFSFSGESLGIVSTDINDVISTGESGLFGGGSEAGDTPPAENEEEKDSGQFDNFEPIGSGLFNTPEEKEDEPDEKEGSDEEEVKRDIEPIVNEHEEELEDGGDEVSEPVQFSQLAQDLVDAGIFSEEDDPENVNTAEDLLDRFRGIAKRDANQQINSFFNQAGPEALQAFKAVIVDRVDPETYFKSHSAISSLEGLDLESESNQEMVIKKYYKYLGWDANKVNKKVEKLKDYGDLAEDSQIAHEKLLEIERRSIEEEQNRKRLEQTKLEQSKQHYIQSVNSILQEKLQTKDFDGLPVNEDIASKTSSYMTQPKYTLTKTGEHITEFDKFLLELKNPENYEKALKIALLEQSGWDFSKVKSKAVSQASNKLFQRSMQKEKVSRRKTPVEDNFII